MMRSTSIMTVNKDLYKQLFHETCRGMRFVTRGQVSRYELLLHEPSHDRWIEIRQLTHSNNEEMNDFFQGARGNYFVNYQNVQHVLRMSDILAGEHLELTVQSGNSGQVAIIRFLKLAPECMLITDGPKSVSTVRLPREFEFRFENIELPTFGSVKLSSERFIPPTVYHRNLDAALMRNFRNIKTKDDISPVYNQVAAMCQHESTVDDINLLVSLLAECGVSTYSARVIFDTCCQQINQS